MGLSFALDFVEMDLLGVPSNHSKRIAYISLKIADRLGLTFKEKHDIVALSILHDNGASEKILHEKLTKRDLENINILESIKEHCIIGEKNIINYPFLTDTTNIIKYHHEKYNGTGFFNKKAADIPLIAQIISFADILDLNFNLKSTDIIIQREVANFVKQNENIYFSKNMVNAFYEISKHKAFWLDLKDSNIDIVLRNNIPCHSIDISLDELHTITQVLSKIIDSKSKYTQTHSQELANKVVGMADYYGLDYEHKMKLVIAADLHDIGKLAIPNSMLDNPNKLTEEEFEVIKEHPYYTNAVLREISGFEQILCWASNHHERLDGSGYPTGLNRDKLDFESRLIACLDVYQALTEERPYRRKLNHIEAMDILHEMKDKGMLDGSIIKDIDLVFTNR